MEKTLIIIREEILRGLKRELIGPEPSLDIEYTLSEYPYNRYFTGILAPNKIKIENTENDDLRVAGDDSGEESSNQTSTNLLKFQKQSSFGLTFAVPPKTIQKIRITYRGGIYYRTGQGEAEIYTFIPFEFIYSLNLEKNVCDMTLISEKYGKASNIKEGGDLNIKDIVTIKPLQVIRELEECSTVTISISNISDKKAIENYIFSNELMVEILDEEDGFIDRKSWYTSDRSKYPDFDSLSQEFLHREVYDYAVGHGVSVQWEGTPCRKLHTEFIPAHEVGKIVPSTLEDDEFLTMENLWSTQSLIFELKDFVEGYENWYNRKNEDISIVEERYQEIAGIHLDDIKLVIDRIKMSIDLIESDEIVEKAFRLMNKTMGILWSSPIYIDRLAENEKPKWRPFQLAFILFAMEAIVNESSDSRKEIDLLWFPTGGGKSMAYMGLMALTLIFRRLKWGERGEGPGVISRYTLRLLALQQFQISTTLMCSLEILRAQIPELGNTEFSIGYWVGNNTTPVNVKKAKESLSAEYAGLTSIKQFQTCPWCGDDLRDESYSMFVGQLDNAKVKCVNKECEFNIGIPAYMTDGQIYKNAPSIILGTIDKFARVPKVADTKNILANDKYRSIDLIVQDELHLINGPLGSMYGIYEMMVEGIISSFDMNKIPKIIASTATIKRAPAHIKKIYGRVGRIFPPVAFKANDIYWAKQIPTNEVPGRLYVGIHPQGKSPTNALKTVIAYHLAKVYNLRNDMEDSLLDPYWTVVGYYSSIRELGSAMMLAVDVIPDRIKQLSDNDKFKEQRKLKYPEELTSRLNSSEISEILRRLDYKLEGTNDPIDTLFATNMISVGVDIPRLSNMIVVSQPKSTAEYIQATSRIGRKYPGIVSVLYNWTRPRDRSHYERFQYYHETLNSQVDPLSSTPFSIQVRERALHATIIGLVRHVVEGKDKESKAGILKLKENVKQQIKSYIKEWLGESDISELDDTLDEIDKIFDDWDKKSVEFNDKVKYNKKSKEDPNNSNSLMVSMDQLSATNGFPKKTPDSLRNVESGIDLKIKRIRRRK